MSFKAKSRPGSQLGTVSGAPQRTRLKWPDTARGLSILGVVTLHVTLAVPEGLDTQFAHFNTFLDPLRLPLFFLVSGYFSVKVLRMGLLELISRRLWYFAVPYIVWSTADLVSNSHLYHEIFGDPLRTKSEIAELIWLGHSMGWFLHALFWYNIFIWLLRRLPHWAKLAASFLPVLLVGYAETYYALGKAVMFLPIFVLGVVGQRYIMAFTRAVARFRFSSWRSWAMFAAVVALYSVGWLSRHRWDTRHVLEPVFPWILPGTEAIGSDELLLFVRFVQQVCELPLALMLSVALVRVPLVGRFLRFIGSHTLPIYLGHPVALTLGFGFLQVHHNWDISIGGPWPTGNTYFWILACLGISAAGSWIVWLMGEIPVLRWTVRPPALRLRSIIEKRRAKRATQAAAE